MSVCMLSTRVSICVYMCMCVSVHVSAYMCECTVSAYMCECTCVRIHVCVGAHVCECRCVCECPQRPERGIIFFGCKSSDVGEGNPS